MKLSKSTKPFTLIIFLIVSTFAYLITFNVQTASASEWQLTINGSVENQLSFSINDIKAMPSTTELATIFCVDFPNQIVTTGIWTGVTLSTLLAQAGVQSSAVKVGFFASDGYTTDLDIATATSATVIVAYAKDGEPLSETLRLVVPGRWGYKWISQLTTITLFEYDFKGKWESQGYSDDAFYDSAKTTSYPQYRSTSPAPIEPTPTTTTPSTTPTTNSTAATPPTEEQNTNPTLEPQPTDYLTPVLEISIPAIAIAALASVAIVRKRHRQETKN